MTKIDKLTATGYTQVGLTNGDRYYYVVAAVNASGEGPVSAEASATPQLPAPGAPLSLAATAGDTQVQLSWSPSLNATTYNVYWSNVAGVKPGSAGVTQIPGVTATNYMHTGLKNGDTYYYVVTAVTAMIEGAASAETSARPLPPAPPAPLGLTAIAAKDVLEIAVQWFDVPDYPSSTAPVQVGYNLYRGLQPGVASYYKDAAKAIKVANVTAPYIDTALTTATTYYYVVTSFAPGFSEVESAPSGEVTATSGRAGGGGGEEGFGNNLSVPLVFADSYGLTGLKISGSWPGVGPFATLPAFDFPSFDASTAVAIAGITYYPQGTASTWQAEWRNNAAGSTLEVVLDWGDALLARTYTANSVIRIETTLVQDASIAGVTDTMTAYKMALLSGSGITELRGTDKSTFASASRNVFAINARLKIEKISTDGSPDTVIYNKAIYEAFGTTSGLIVYGKNFFMTQVTGVPSKTGQYRITFSLDPEAAVGAVKVPNHIRIVNKSDAGATLAPDGLSSSVVITVN
ncbi:MAG: fibronectin type III domain-containing protein [Xanthomonadales bacterium]|nr:fibronectin type III domain-containing protein [Xanthomonadales bacterium]